MCSSDLLAAFGFLLLGLAAALALGAFVRFYGVIFLGRPRINAVEQAHESPVSMTIAMGMSALLVLALGIFCVPVVDLATKVINNTLVNLPALNNALIITFPTANGTGSYLPLALVILLIILGIILYMAGYKKTVLVRHGIFRRVKNNSK